MDILDNFSDFDWTKIWVLGPSYGHSKKEQIKSVSTFQFSDTFCESIFRHSKLWPGAKNLKASLNSLVGTCPLNRIKVKSMVPWRKGFYSENLFWHDANTIYSLISRPRVARAGTNKLKCRKNPHRVLTWQKPPQSATFWRNFNSL